MEKNTDALNLAINTWQQSETDLSNRRNAFKLFYNNYRQVYSDPVDESNYTNNTFDPITMETCETFRPFLCRRLPELSHVPTEPSDDEIARRMTNWQRYQWYRQKMKQKRKSLAFYTELYGTGILYQFYRLDQRKRPRRSFAKDGKATVKTETVTLYDDPDCRIIDVTCDFFPDPYGLDVDDCDFIMFREFRKYEEIVEESKGDDPFYSNLPDIEEMANCYDLWLKASDKQDMDRFKDNKSLSALAKQGIVEVLHYWQDDHLISVGHREWVLRDDDNPFPMLGRKPFARFTCLDNPHEFWGIGRGEMLCRFQHEVNTVGRLTIDGAKRALRGAGVAPLNSGIDLGPLYDMEKYVVESPQASTPIQWIPAPNFTNVGMPTKAEMLERAATMTGATPLFKGSVSGGDDTATKARIEQNNLLARAFYTLDNLDEGFARWMENNVGLAQQYYQQQREYRISGETGGILFGTINYEDLLAGLDIQVRSNSGQPITVDEKSLQADRLAAMFRGDPSVKQEELTSLLMKMIEPPEDFRRLLYTPEESAQIAEAQRKAAEQAAEQAHQRELELIFAKRAQEPEPEEMNNANPR